MDNSDEAEDVTPQRKDGSHLQARTRTIPKGRVYLDPGGSYDSDKESLVSSNDRSCYGCSSMHNVPRKVILSVVCQEYHNSPPGCHRHICIVWKASVQCEGCFSRLHQFLSTHQNDDASNDAPSEDDAGISTAQTPPQPPGIINVKMPDAPAPFGIDLAN